MEDPTKGQNATIFWWRSGVPGDSHQKQTLVFAMMLMYPYASRSAHSWCKVFSTLASVNDVQSDRALVVITNKCWRAGTKLTIRAGDLPTYLGTQVGTLALFILVGLEKSN